MSYLGLHIASGVRPRFGDYLRAGLSCVVCLEQNVQSEVKSISPSTKTFWRTQKPKGLDNPQGFMDFSVEQMPAVATNWMNGLRPYWLLNKHDVLIVNNEQDIGTLESGRKLNAFNLQCMKVAESWGDKVGICSYSTGNPTDDGGLTCEQRWETVLESVQYALEHGHYLVLHAHINQQKDHFGDTGFRHERALRFFEARGLKTSREWIVLGEWSNGTGGVQNNTYDYMNNVRAWDTYALSSPYSTNLVGAALYGFNSAETLQDATPQLLEWIGKNPGKYTPPPVTSNVITVTPAKTVKVFQQAGLEQVTIYAPLGVKVEVK